MSNPIVRKNDPVTGKTIRLAFWALALAGATAATQAQSQWNRVYQGLVTTPDASWGVADFHTHPSRLVSDARGNLFISLKESLYMRKVGGQTWDVVARMKWEYPYPLAPLAVGGEGQVLWGEWASTNWGETWLIMPRNYGLYGSYAIGPNGVGLVANSATIMRSKNGGAEWGQVYYSGSFDSFDDLAVSSSGWAFTTTFAGYGMVSRDTGTTWVPLDSVLSGPKFSGGSGPIKVTAEKGGVSGSFWTAMHASLGGKGTCAEFQRQGNSLVFRSPANSGFPDSAVTALQAYGASVYQSVLWLGTWGQGVYTSRDRGATWERFNSGLGDLHVEAITVTPSGAAYVLTKEGLFSTLPSTAVRIKATGSLGEANRSGFSGAAPLFGNAAGRFFRINGRIAHAVRADAVK